MCVCVSAKPYITSTSGPTVVSREGDDVILRCVSDSKPTPVIHWTHNVRLVPPPPAYPPLALHYIVYTDTFSLLALHYIAYTDMFWSPAALHYIVVYTDTFCSLAVLHTIVVYTDTFWSLAALHNIVVYITTFLSLAALHYIVYTDTFWSLAA